ncbi:MAG: hypothetical protein A2Y17_12210 [Clostridiales bacterium GWF2_38_85]|nr:MAG: hypothetical protein A2Y17_12210 [Clostridiales bacterium GWF2_38_85]
MRCLYREKYYECGDYLEVNLFPAYKKAKQRNKKAKPTTEVQEKLNQTNAENKLVRLMNANFTADDIKCELSYDNSCHPESDEQAARDLQNFLRRLKRFRNKQGLPELKYITATEKGTKKGRYHHHITISGGITPKQLAEIWGKGYVQKIQPLQFDECGIVGIAKYYPKEPIFFKRWNTSKNLVHPEPQRRDGRLSKKVVEELARDTENGREYEKYFDGYFFAQAHKLINDYNGGVYLQIRLYKKEANLCKVKKRKQHPKA